MSEVQNVQLQLQWVGDLSSPPAAVNQFAISPGVPYMDGSLDEHQVLFGHFTPPMMQSALSELELQQLAAQPQPVFPVGRFLLSTQRLRDLRDVIDQHLTNVDAARR